MLLFPEITKTHKMQVSKATSSIMRLFALMNIHYHKNTKERSKMKLK